MPPLSSECVSALLRVRLNPSYRWTKPLRNTGHCQLLTPPAPWKVSVRMDYLCPGQCGSFGWRTSLYPKGCWFDSQSGHRSRLQVRFFIPNPQSWCIRTLFYPHSGRVLEAPRCLSPSSVFISLPFSLPAPLSKSHEKKMSS